MKDFLDKIKALNYKELAIEHGEKAVFGVVVLLILMALAGTSWSRYEKQPSEFTDKVSQEDSNLVSSQWPAEKRKQYDSITDLTQSVNELLDPSLNVTKFEYGTPYVHPLYKPQEKIREPEWLAILDLKADYSYAIFQYRPEAPVVEEETGDLTIIVENEDEDIALPVDPNAPRAGTTARSNDESSASLDLDEADDASMEEEDDSSVEDFEEADEGDGTDESGDGGFDSGGDDAGGIPVASINAEGRRFIAIRGVVPLKDQLEKLSIALNQDVPARAAEMLEYIDFELERQQAIEGPDPWVIPWEKVDLQVALDVLDTVDDFDADVVSSTITDPVITMPLPRRIAGNWDTWASHPQLKTLSKNEREAQMVVNKKTIELAKVKLKERQTLKKGGFAGKQQDIRGTRRRLGRHMRTVRERAAEEMSSEKYRSYTGVRGGAGLANQGAHAEIAGKALLYRYLDFSIEPGNAYRYRVRLIARNPNFERPIEQLVNPDFAKGETRPTPWSNVTVPIVVPSEVQVFLSKVTSGFPQATVNINIFQWYSKAGTHILGELKRLVRGQIIAAFTEEDRREKVTGGIETVVLRPANQTMQVEKNVEVVTRNVLLDIDEPLEIDEDAHRELGIDFKRMRTQLKTDQALAVNQYGELIILNGGSQQKQMQTVNALLDRERSPWLQFVVTETRREDRNQNDSLLGDDLDEDAGPTRRRTSRRRGRNPIMKRGR